MDSGPAQALLYVLLVAAILVVALAGLVVSRRRPERLPPPAAPEEAPEIPPPLEAPGSQGLAVEAPPVEAPPAAEAPAAPPEAAPTLAPPRAEAPPGPAPVEAPPAAEAPAVPPIEAAPAAQAPPAPPVDAPPAPMPPVEVAPLPAEAPAPPAPPRRRIRGIGGALTRIFRGGALSPEDWEELEEVLLRADVGVAATTRIVSALRQKKVSDGMTALRDELLEVLGQPDRELRRKPDGLTVWLVTGVNGSGKTTTIGKLAARLTGGGSRVILAAADTFRAAADQQLEQWAERARADIVKHSPGADPAAVVFDGVKAAQARDADVLIVDTAGRLQNKKNLMEELSKMRRVLVREAGEPDEVLLVLDATTGQNGVQQARAFTEAAPLTGIALTKLDGTAKGGIVVAVQQELGIPVKLVGLGEGLEDLAPFDAASFVSDLLEG